MTFESGPDPDPDAEPHGDFEPDDLAFNEEVDLDEAPLNLYSDEERETYVVSYPDEGEDAS